MTDAHFHKNGFETYLTLNDREFRFLGIHPWQVDNSEFGIRNSELNNNSELGDVNCKLQSFIFELNNNSKFGVGEIGLDRLKSKTVSDAQRKAFADQLAAAAELRRPVVLHGAKCWGEVAKECRKYTGTVPAFLFHGFSRSTGLVPDVIALNGFISLGPALLNDHAVNYHLMAKELPIDRIMLETDIDWSARQPTGSDIRAGAFHAPGNPHKGAQPPLGDLLRAGAFHAPDHPSQSALLAQMLDKLARLRGCDAAALAAAIDANVVRFIEAIA